MLVFVMRYSTFRVEFQRVRNKRERENYYVYVLFTSFSRVIASCEQQFMHKIGKIRILVSKQVNMGKEKE